MKQRIKQQIDQKKRKKILVMSAKGYPSDYIAEYFNVTPARISQILKEEKLKSKKVAE